MTHDEDSQTSAQDFEDAQGDQGDRERKDLSDVEHALAWERRARLSDLRHIGLLLDTLEKQLALFKTELERLRKGVPGFENPANQNPKRKN